MKISKLKYCFLQGKLSLLLLAIVFSLIAGNTFAQKKSKKKATPWEIRIGIGLSYDDNILKYSKKYLDRFMNGEDPGRFHIETYDDAILFTSARLTYTFNVFGGRFKTKVNGEVSRRTYIVNDIKTWNYALVGLQQYLGKKTFFKISYSYIPEFYVRHFRDDQWIDVYGYTPEAFQPYAFSKDNFGIYLQHTFFKYTRVKLSLYHALYYHNQHYTEYDSKDFLYGIMVNQRLHKNFSIEGSYTWVTSDAKGYDASVDTPETTHGPDATFVEDRFKIGFVWKFPRIKKHSHYLDFDVAFMNRYYSSKHTPLQDPLHAGRYDKNVRFYFNYNFRVSKKVNLTAFYNHYLRDTDTKAQINSRYVSNEKDYHQNIVGLKATFTFKM